MMTLDSGFTIKGDTFKDVRINSALTEEGGIDFSCGIGEDFDKLLADDLAFAFGFIDTCELIKEAVGCVDVDQIHIEGFGEDLLNIFGFIFAQESMVDENACQLFTDGFVDESRHDAGVNAAGESQDHGLVAHLSADIRHSFFDKVFHGPLAGASALVEAEFDQRFHSGGIFQLHRRNAGEHGCGAIDSDLGQIKSGDTGCLGGEFGFIVISAEDDTHRFFRLEPFQRNGTRHNHSIDLCTANSACDFLDLIAIAIHQNHCFRSNFHSNLTSM